MSYHYEDDLPPEPKLPFCDHCHTEIFDGDGRLDALGHIFHARSCYRRSAALEDEPVLEPDQEDGGCN